jgi:endonuclease/exonuclease/phosphatase family metal-dependent hydrolase
MAFRTGRGAPAGAALARLAPALLAAVLALASCGRAILYPDPEGPRYAESFPARPDPEPALRLVTFNIEYARRIDTAIALLREDPRLRDADLLFLQEMDEPGTRRIAEALGMSFLYYPAVVHPKAKHDFGNAILSRWPIRDGRKVILPHLARFSGSQRIAVTGTVDIGGEPVRLYTVHVALPYTVGGKDQRDQLRAVLDDAAGWPGRVIIAGDFNSHGLGGFFARTGYSWPSRRIGSTAGWFDVDQVFLRGFRLVSPESIGAVRENRGASDHRPVWAVLAPDTVPAQPPGGYRFARPDSSFPIKRFAWVDSTLARGARPGPGGLRALRERGFRTVIDFAGTSGEQALAAAESLDYVPIPLTAHLWSSPPTEEQVRRFFEIVLDPARRPVFIHCAHGEDRTGMMAALYRIEAQGWQPSGAIEEMRLLGYHGWYNDLENYARDYVPRGYARRGGGSPP